MHREIGSTVSRPAVPPRCHRGSEGEAWEKGADGESELVPECRVSRGQKEEGAGGPSACVTAARPPSRWPSVRPRPVGSASGRSRAAAWGWRVWRRRNERRAEQAREWVNLHLLMSLCACPFVKRYFVYSSFDYSNNLLQVECKVAEPKKTNKTHNKSLPAQNPPPNSIQYKMTSKEIL